MGIYKGVIPPKSKRLQTFDQSTRDSNTVLCSIFGYKKKNFIKNDSIMSMRNIATLAPCVATSVVGVAAISS